MDKMLTVSIVTYKTQVQYLQKSVSDLFREEDGSVFIVIADNNSGEDYLRKVSSSLPVKENLKILSTGANKGYGFGHNFALNNCPPSQYHLVMNADVEIDEGTIKILITKLRANKNIGLVVPRIENPDGSLQALNKRNPTLLDMFLRFFGKGLRKCSLIGKRMDYYEMQDYGYNNEVDVPYASGCFMLFRTDVLKEIGGFDETFFMYLEDADITRRASKVSRSVYVPEARIIHRWNRASHKSLKFFMITLHSMYVYFKKWGVKLF